MKGKVLLEEMKILNLHKRGNLREDVTKEGRCMQHDCNLAS